MTLTEGKEDGMLNPRSRGQCPLDAFSIDAVYAYGLRLMLVERMRKFEVENGKTSYHKIYDTILDGDK